MRSPLSHDERFKNQSNHEKERISGEDWITEFKAKERMVFAKTLASCVVFIVLAIIALTLMSAFGLVAIQPLMLFSILLLALLLCSAAIIKMLKR